MDKEFSYVIIENNLEAKKYLKELLIQNHKYLKNVGEATTIKEGIAIVTTTQPNILFLDVELDDGLCFEILDHFPNPNFEIIFTTAYQDYLEKAMQHFAFYYLLKPIDPVALSQVLYKYLQLVERSSRRLQYELLKNFMAKQDAKIWVHTGDEHITVTINEISHCTAQGNYTQFHLQDRSTLLASNSLKYYEELLQIHHFFRASRSHLINVAQVHKVYKKETLIMNNGANIHISTRNKPALIALIKTLT